METSKIQAQAVLIKALDMLGLTQNELAILIGKDPTTVYRYVKGEVGTPEEVFSEIMSRLQRNEINPLECLGIENEEDFYFHSAPSPLVGDIDVNYNRDSLADFGHGFYLGKTLRQSASWAKRPGGPIYIYRFKREKFSKLVPYRFDQDHVFDWLCFIALNRHKIPDQYAPRIAYAFAKMEDYDFIEGKITDSFSFQIIEGFFQGIYDLDQAVLCTKILALGDQLCLKKKEFASALQPDELYILDSTISRYFASLGKEKQSQQDQDSQRILQRTPNPEKVFANLLKKNYGKK